MGTLQPSFLLLKQHEFRVQVRCAPMHHHCVCRRSATAKACREGRGTFASLASAFSASHAAALSAAVGPWCRFLRSASAASCQLRERHAALTTTRHMLLADMYGANCKPLE